MSGNHDHNGEHHPEPQSYAALRTKAIESLLIEKGLLSTDAIDVRVQAYEQDIGPLNGAKVVVRAWTDAEYKRASAGGRDGGDRRTGFLRRAGSGDYRAGEHTDGSQCGRMHALLLLPLARAWPAAALVQVGCLQGEGGHRAASRAAGVRAGRWTNRWRCVCGTATRIFDIWCCRSDRRTRRIRMRMRLLRW